MPVGPETSTILPGCNRGTSFHEGATKPDSIGSAYRTYVRCTTRCVPLLQFVQVLGPIVLQEQRERTVGQQLPTRLAGGAVVGLVVGIDDPLHRRATPRTGLLELAVDGHVRPEGSHLLRPPLPHFGTKPIAPFHQGLLDGSLEPLHLLRPHRPRARGGSDLCLPQD